MKTVEERDGTTEVGFLLSFPYKRTSTKSSTRSGLQNHLKSSKADVREEEDLVDLRTPSKGTELPTTTTLHPETSTRPSDVHPDYPRMTLGPD